jgi:hypothetical protein
MARISDGLLQKIGISTEERRPRRKTRNPKASKAKTPQKKNGLTKQEMTYLKGFPPSPRRVIVTSFEDAESYVTKCDEFIANLEKQKVPAKVITKAQQWRKGWLREMYRYKMDLDATTTKQVPKEVLAKKAAKREESRRVRQSMQGRGK